MKQPTRMSASANSRRPHPKPQSRTASQDTCAKDGKRWNPEPRARELTPRQKNYLELRMTRPWPSAAKCARLAGYSKWVARRATVIIDRSPAVRRVLDRWNAEKKARWDAFARSLRGEESKRTRRSRLRSRARTLKEGTNGNFDSE